jgi:hypothetical protein
VLSSVLSAIPLTEFLWPEEQRKAVRAPARSVDRNDIAELRGSLRRIPRGRAVPAGVIQRRQCGYPFRPRRGAFRGYC